MEAGPTSSLPIYLDVFNTYTHYFCQVAHVFMGTNCGLEPLSSG